MRCTPGGPPTPAPPAGSPRCCPWRTRRTARSSPTTASSRTRPRALSADELPAVPIVGRLAELDLVYLHLIAEPDDPLDGKLRGIWPGTFVLNTGFVVESGRDGAERLVTDGLADAVTVGRPFIANPDLVERWIRGAELNAVDRSLVYGGGAEGYTGYPRCAEFTRPGGRRRCPARSAEGTLTSSQ